MNVAGEAAYTSVFLARLLGPLIAVVGVALLVHPDVYRTMMKEFIRSLALCYLAGFFGLLGGISLVLVHNVWTSDWRIIVTLIGWITIVRAALTLMWPRCVAAIGRRLIQSPQVFTAAAVIDLALGLALSYFGYANS